MTIDHNRSGGVLYVNYTPQGDDEKDFFARWCGGGDDKITEVNYRILVATVGNNVEVRVVGPNGEGLNRAEALRLLTILRSNMS